MAKITNNPDSMSLPSGNIKGTGYQVRRVHNQTFLVRAPGKRTAFSPAEQEAQQRFAEATRLAGLDMKNPQAKAYWNAHKGTRKRAYDAAKAHYLRLLNTPKVERNCTTRPSKTAGTLFSNCKKITPNTRNYADCLPARLTVHVRLRLSQANLLTTPP